MKGRKRLYKDDILITRAFRISKKYEIKEVMDFIQILRNKRDLALNFIEKNRG